MKNFKKLNTVLFAAALVFSAGVYFSLFFSDNHQYSYLRPGKVMPDLGEMNGRYMDPSEVISPTPTLRGENTNFNTDVGVNGKKDYTCKTLTMDGTERLSHFL